MTTFVVGAKRFDNKLHAQWSQFLASLQIEHQYITDKTDSEGSPNPTFWLPKFHTIDGIYLLVGGGDIPAILKSGKQPLWTVGSPPDAVVSYLWWLDEFDNAQRISVLPGFGAAYAEHKLFTEPRAVDATGRVRGDVLKRHGQALIKAIADSRSVKEAGGQRVMEMLEPFRTEPRSTSGAERVLPTKIASAGLWFGDEASGCEFVGNGDGSVEIRVGDNRHKLTSKQWSLVVNYFAESVLPSENSF